jgi:hypothetical protein
MNIIAVIPCNQYGRAKAIRTAAWCKRAGYDTVFVVEESTESNRVKAAVELSGNTDCVYMHFGVKEDVIWSLGRVMNRFLRSNVSYDILTVVGATSVPEPGQAEIVKTFVVPGQSYIVGMSSHVNEITQQPFVTQYVSGKPNAAGVGLLSIAKADMLEYNEEYIGWGWEDFELLGRLNLRPGYTVYRITQFLHESHERWPGKDLYNQNNADKWLKSGLHAPFMKEYKMLTFEEWRTRYDTMTYDEQVAFYRDVCALYPVQRYFDLDFALNNLPRKTRTRVIEVGGWDGELAAGILAQRKGISSWINYEIAPQVVSSPVCTDKRYKAVLPNDFAWNVAESGDVLFMSHSLEHMRMAEFKLLVQRVCPSTILLTAPLQETGVPNYKGYHGTHIFDGAWVDVDTALEAMGYTRTLANGDNRVFKKLE